MQDVYMWWGVMLLEQLTPELLEKLYSVDLLTESDIAAQFGTYQVKINRLRKKWGIPTIGKTGRIAQQIPTLTDLQQELVVGSLLGDGYMVAPSTLTAAFHESHSLKQRDYLHWKGDLLKEHCSSYSLTTKTEGEKVFHGERLTGVASVHMRGFYDLFYPAPARVRVFPPDLYKRMSPFVLAVWYMDDGGLMHRFHPRITFGLDSKSLHRAKRALRTLGLKPKVHPGHNAQTITFPGQDRAFFDLVAPHIPLCMAYKLPQGDTPRREVDLRAKGLTSERAEVLYTGGLTLDQIASLYKVGRSTVRRRLLSGGVDCRRPGTASGQLSMEAATEVLSGYSPSDWPDLTIEGQDQWVSEILQVLRGSEFPYPRHLSDRKFARELELVSNTSMVLDGRRIQPWSVVGNRACLPYFRNRYRAASKSKRTAFEAWHDDKTLDWAVRYQLKVGDPVVPHRVLRAVTMGHRTPSVFRATVAKFIYETYAKPGDKVWDPCAGYGGRLLGAFSAGVGYVGTDVEPETVEGNLELAKRLGYPAQVHLCAAEAFNPGPVDLVFTSPPYFDREQYSKSHLQSWVRHGSTLEAWVEGFMLPVFQSAWDNLPPGKHLVWNIADLKEGRKVIPLVDTSVRAAQSVGFEHVDTLEMPLARLNREDAFEPVLVFQRPERTL